MMRWKHLLRKFGPGPFFVKLYAILLTIFGVSAILAYIFGQVFIAKSLGMCALWPLFGLMLNGGLLYYRTNKRKNE